jgi:hypothetical protein
MRKGTILRVCVGGICLIVCLSTVSAVLGYDLWLQTSKDASHSGSTPGIPMYPVNEFPRPTGGENPTYAFIHDLTEPINPDNGNIQTHIAAWYEGSQVEDNLRVAFTTTNSDGVGAIYLVNSDGDNIGNYPVIFENVNGVSTGNIESSIAVYYDEYQQQEEETHETVLVAALNAPNRVYAYDLDKHCHWWYDSDDWVSEWCSPVVYEHPPWIDGPDGGNSEDDFVYVFNVDTSNQQKKAETSIVSLDLTLDQVGGPLASTYSSAVFSDMTPTSSTPAILRLPGLEGPGLRLLDDPIDRSYMFCLLDQWTWSVNLEDWLKTGTRVVCIDLDPSQMQGGRYATIFNIQLPVYDSIVIPGSPPESIDLRYTSTTNPVAVRMREYVDPNYVEWYGVVFGADDGSDGPGKDVFFVEIDGTISASHDLSYPSTPLGGGMEQQTDPLVVGSPAARPDLALTGHPDEIYVLYEDRTTGRTGAAYFDEITEIGSNVIFQYPMTLPADEYLPMSPVITDEYLYVGCGYQDTASPYRYHGGMVYINLEMIRVNGSCGFFNTLPWALEAVAGEQHWLATPAILQISSSEQYIFMGTAAADLGGGYLWRLST